MKAKDERMPLARAELQPWLESAGVLFELLHRITCRVLWTGL